MGPMVIRVYPDGRPVAADAQRPLPKDEDIEDIRYDTRLPSIKDIEGEEPAREMLPPRKSIRAQRYPPPMAPRLYANNVHLARAAANNLLIRERFF